MRLRVRTLFNAPRKDDITCSSKKPRDRSATAAIAEAQTVSRAVRARSGRSGRYIGELVAREFSGKVFVGKVSRWSADTGCWLLGKSIKVIVPGLASGCLLCLPKFKFFVRTQH